jgi:hypothetical protein
MMGAARKVSESSKTTPEGKEKGKVFDRGGNGRHSAAGVRGVSLGGSNGGDRAGDGGESFGDLGGVGGTRRLWLRHVGLRGKGVDRGETEGGR